MWGWFEKQLLWDACNKFKNGITEFWGTGQEKRDWISPSDVAGLVYAITMQPKKEKYVFNACNGEAVKIVTFLKKQHITMGSMFRLYLMEIKICLTLKTS